MGDLFELAVRTRVVHGEGAARRLGEIVCEVLDSTAAARVLLVTDAGLVATGLVAGAEASLHELGHEVVLFSDVSENPTTDDVGRCVDAARAFAPQILVGFGGGSSIDVAKGANFLITNGGAMADYLGDGKSNQPLLPLIAVPTTAGTGTEVQRFTLIADATSHQKMACGDARATPCVAILDPCLTVSLPRAVTAGTGLDAIGHAVEAAVTRARTPESARCASAAFTLAIQNLPRVLEHPGDLTARGAMLRAATLAGLAIEYSMLGAAHSMANPLTAHLGLAHGHAVGLCLPHVVRYNAQDPASAAIYARLAEAAGLGGVDDLIEVLGRRLSEAGMPTTLADCGADGVNLDLLGAEAAMQWTAQFNPRVVDAAAFRSLYARL